MTEAHFAIAGLTAGTIAVRLLGVYAGRRIPDHGPWARALNALPGCLIVALVTTMLLGGGPPEWISAGVAGAVALATRNLPLTMVAGVICVGVLRAFV